MFGEELSSLANFDAAQLHLLHEKNRDFRDEEPNWLCAKIAHAVPKQYAGTKAHMLSKSSKPEVPEGTGEKDQSASLDAIVRACVRGDQQAMASLYDRCSNRVYALMVRIVGRQDADDLTQDVFLQMFRKLGQFNGQSKLETWLYRLATNEALQHLRQRKRHAAGPLLSEPVVNDPSPATNSEESELLEGAILSLEPELRAVLILKEQEGLSYAEIASIVEIPEGTVGSRLNRARKELRQQLTKLGWES